MDVKWNAKHVISHRLELDRRCVAFCSKWSSVVAWTFSPWRFFLFFFGVSFASLKTSNIWSLWKDLFLTEIFLCALGWVNPNKLASGFDVLQHPFLPLLNQINNSKLMQAKRFFFVIASAIRNGEQNEKEIFIEVKIFQLSFEYFFSSSSLRFRMLSAGEISQSKMKIKRIENEHSFRRLWVF